MEKMGTQLEEKPGNLFLSAPPNAILVHACNTRGSWGAGVALAFKQRFPAAYRAQYAHCCPSTKQLKDRNARDPSQPTNLATYQRSLVGTTLLIAPPSASEDGNGEEKERTTAIARKRKRGEDDTPSSSGAKPTGATATGTYIACLFTSNNYGRAKDTPTAILAATRSALRDLAEQIASLPAPSSDDEHSTTSSTHDDPPAPAAGADTQQGWVCAMPRINSGLFSVPWDQTRAVLEEVLVAAGVNVLVFVPDGEAGAGAEMAKGGKSRLGVGGKKTAVAAAAGKAQDDDDGDGDGDGAREKKKIKTPPRRDLDLVTKERGGASASAVTGAGAGTKGKRVTGMDRWLQGRQ